jgi:putative membrane-bound dehydrogenase-like protein
MPFSHVRCLRVFSILCLAARFECAVPAAPALAQSVPAGFRAELLFSPPEIEHPSVVTCDDQGNLFVGEDPMDMRGPTTKEFDRIILLRWNAKTGEPIRTVFCQNLSAVFGLVWHEGALYVMHAPHYSKFQDTDGDGVADVRQDLAQGFGPPAGFFGFNDHIVTGTRLGLDGRVYVSVGDKGIQKAVGSDGSSITLEGGGVVSMRLDGSQLEIVSSGTRNHLDVAMDSLDNIFTYDNTDDGLGWWTRFTHHVPTGYYGYPFDYLAHRERHLPRISEHGGGSPVGADCYREAAWPAMYRDKAFHCEWGKGKIQRFTTHQSGATFTAEMEDFMVGDSDGQFRPQDLCFSPDGKYMYVADWNCGGWCKPTVLGRLFRVSYVGGEAPPEPARTPDAAPLEEQLAALAHPAHSERMRAQWTLAGLGRAAIEPVTALLGSSAPKLAKVHAIWTLNALMDRVDGFEPAATWCQALRDADDDVRSQAARALGSRRAKTALEPLTSALRDPSASVRMWAAIGLGRIGDRRAAPALYAALGDSDEFVRFADVQALRALGDWEPIKKSIASSDELERNAALLALTGVYDDAAVEALAWAVQHAPAEAARARAVESLAEVHSQADPYVQGWWGTQPGRGKPARPKKHPWSGTPLVAAALGEAVVSAEPAVRKVAVKAVIDLKEPAAMPRLTAVALDEKSPASLRADVVHAIVALKTAAARDVLVRLLDAAASPPEVLVAAIDGVSQLPPPTVRPALERLLNHASPDVRARSIVAYAASLEPALAGNTSTDAGPLAPGSPRALATERVIKALDDPEPFVRQAALRAAGDAGLVDALPAMLAAGHDLATRDDAIRALAKMPDRRALALYLDGVTDKNPVVRDAARVALLKLGQTIEPAILELYKRNELPVPVRAELQSIINAPRPVMTWQVVGPWPKDHEPQFDTTQGPDFGQAVTIEGRAVAWREIGTQNPQGRITLNQWFKPEDDVWAMAYAAIDVAEDRASYFQIGSDDQAILWINGDKRYEFREGGGWAPDTGNGSMQLKKGRNHVWLQVGNGGGPWEFSLAVSSRKPEFEFLYDKVPPKLDARAYRDFADRTPGNAERGKALFADVKGVGCIKCHAVAGQGGKIGPDLVGIGAKYPRADLIRSVLEPSNRVAEGYVLTTIITDAGKIYTGILKTNAQDVVEVLDAQGVVTSIPTSEIEARRTSETSLMPSGLQDGMTLDDFTDLIEYLQSLK